MIAVDLVTDIIASVSIIGAVGILLKLVWDNRSTRLKKLEDETMSKELCVKNHALEENKMESLEKRLEEIQRENKERHQDIKDQLTSLTCLLKTAITFRKREADCHE